MAVQTTTDDNVIYIVEISMGSQFRGKSWDLDDFNRQMEYKHGKKVRNEIGAIRQEINTVVNGTCMKFHKKIKFTGAAGKAALEKACAEADQKMKRIDPSLHVTPMFFEQTVTQLSDGNMFALMQRQLNEQINQRALDRIQDAIENAQVKDENGNVIKTKPITQKTKTALLNMLEGLKAINILGDPNVDNRINTLKDQIQNQSLDSIRTEIENYIVDIQNEDDLELPISKELKDEVEKDEEKYRAKPVTINEIEIPAHQIEDYI